MIRAALFDLDGTLVKTEWLKSLAYAQAVQALSPTPVTIEAVQAVFGEVVGRAREEVSSTLVERFQLKDAAQARLAEFQAQYPWQALARLRLKIYEEMLADPGVLRVNQWPHNVDLLRVVHRTGCRTALASMSHCKQVMQVLRAINLDDQFDVILSREDVEQPKPHPEIYLCAARLLEVEPQECLVIEDSPVGVQAALSAGMNCIAVATPFTRETLHTPSALPTDWTQEWIVDDPCTLPAVVERLMAQRQSIKDLQLV